MDRAIATPDSRWPETIRVRIGDQEARIYPQAGGISYQRDGAVVGWVVCDDPDPELGRVAEHVRALYHGPRDLPPDAATVPVGWASVATPTAPAYGRVMMRAGGARVPYHKSFLVRRHPDGGVEYWLGTDLAHTSDGWVDLPAEHHPSITWD